MNNSWLEIVLASVWIPENRNTSCVDFASTLRELERLASTCSMYQIVGSLLKFICKTYFPLGMIGWVPRQLINPKNRKNLHFFHVDFASMQQN